MKRALTPGTFDPITCGHLGRHRARRPTGGRGGGRRGRLARRKALCSRSRSASSWSVRPPRICSTCAWSPSTGLLVDFRQGAGRHRGGQGPASHHRLRVRVPDDGHELPALTPAARDAVHHVAAAVHVPVVSSIVREISQPWTAICSSSCPRASTRRSRRSTRTCSRADASAGSFAGGRRSAVGPSCVGPLPPVRIRVGDTLASVARLCRLDAPRPCSGGAHRMCMLCSSGASGGRHAIMLICMRGLMPVCLNAVFKRSKPGWKDHHGRNRGSGAFGRALDSA